MTITITRAEARDLPHIAHLFSAYRVFYQQAEDYPLALNFLQERFDRQESVIFCAKSSQSEYLGFTQLYPTFSSVSAKKVWILNDLYVSERARNLGLGKQLLDAAKNFAESQQAKGLSLQTAIDNHGAQRLYESLGYEKVTQYYAYFLTL